MRVEDMHRLYGNSMSAVKHHAEIYQKHNQGQV